MKKTMKKILGLMLVLAMLAALCSCGSTAAPGSTPTSGAQSGTADLPSDPPEDTEAPEAANDPKVTLIASTSFSGTQLTGIYWNYFCDKVSELSGGSLEIDLYMSGTLGGAGEELSMLNSGSIDIMMLFAAANAFSTPTMCPLLFFPNSMETTAAITEYVCYENEASATAIRENLAQYNATLLPYFSVTSEEVWASTKAVTCWADMYDGKYGCPTDSQYSAMGYKNLVFINDSEWYEDLRTGLVDSISCTLADVVTERLYEVAPHFLVRPTYRVDNWMLINTDKYNTLTDAQKEALAAACQATKEYAMSYAQDIAQQFYDVVEENNGTVLEATAEEVEWYLTCADRGGWADMIPGLGGATGTTEQLAIVVEATMDGFREIADYDLGSISDVYQG